MSKAETRIQKKNQATILVAALKVFSQFGFRGSTLDQIATESGLSKPNVLYYFSSKSDIYRALLTKLLQDWLAPVKAINPQGDPVEEILRYANHKLKMSQNFPRESRLFANEIIQGAPQIGDTLRGELRQVIEDLAEIIDGWIDAGQMRSVDPQHLVFSIWAITQHYADFDVQVRAINGDQDPFDDAKRHIEDMLRQLLTP